MVAEVLGSMLAGLGLIFLALKIIEESLRELTGGPLRDVIKRNTSSGIQASFWGLIMGTVSGEPAVVGVIATSLYNCKSITFRNALLMTIWCMTGVCLIYFILFLDVGLYVLFLLGILGFFYLQEKPAKMRHALSFFFAICIMLYGLSLMTSNSDKLAEIPWVSEHLHRLQSSYFSPYIVAALLTLLLQGEDIVLLVLIVNLFEASVITAAQAVFMVMGMHLGLSALTLIIAVNTKGVLKQIFIMQTLFDFLIATLFPVLIAIELITGIPMIVAWSKELTASIWSQLVGIIIVSNIAVSVLFTVCISLLEKWLKKWFPAVVVVDLSEPKYIEDINIHDPQSALDLIDREIGELLNRIPKNIEYKLATSNQETVKEELKLRHEQYMSVIGKIEQALKEIGTRSVDPSTANKMLAVSDRLQIGISLEEGVNHLLRINIPPAAPETLRTLALEICEAQQAQLETILSAVHDNSEEEMSTLNAATANIKTAIESIREAYLKREAGAPLETKAAILHMTSIFERNVWLLRRLIQQYTSIQMTGH